MNWCMAITVVMLGIALWYDMIYYIGRSAVRSFCLNSALEPTFVCPCWLLIILQRALTVGML